MKDKRWKELSSIFKSAPTNLSTVLQKHYSILLWDFEQVYFFGEQGALIPRVPCRKSNPFQMGSDSSVYL
ncbi:hypothetical protein SUGI_0113070 [Cryptomeria japonica]|nr:hypothetical protein SUGI_0113070 [Cryptomeria japonica]